MSERVRASYLPEPRVTLDAVSSLGLTLEAYTFQGFRV
jgi:hypothetical protein